MVVQEENSTCSLASIFFRAAYTHGFGDSVSTHKDTRRQYCNTLRPCDTLHHCFKHIVISTSARGKVIRTLVLVRGVGVRPECWCQPLSLGLCYSPACIWKDCCWQMMGLCAGFFGFCLDSGGVLDCDSQFTILSPLSLNGSQL